MFVYISCLRVTLFISFHICLSFLSIFFDWPLIWIYLLPHYSDWLFCRRFLRQRVFSVWFSGWKEMCWCSLEKFDGDSLFFYNFNKISSMISLFYLEKILFTRYDFYFTLIVHPLNLDVIQLMLASSISPCKISC